MAGGMAAAARHRKLVPLLLIAVLFGQSINAGAQDDRSGLVWMTPDEIRQELTGVALSGIYPTERLWTETIRPDGSTDYREGEKHWQGKWWLRDREFCFTYPEPGVGGCFRITRVSANCYELYDFSGQFGRENEPPHLASLWNGRMWRADRPTTCEDRPIT